MNKSSAFIHLEILLRKLSALLFSEQISEEMFFAFLLKSVLKKMGPSGLEPPTSRLSGVRSNRLSYGPFSWWR